MKRTVTTEDVRRERLLGCGTLVIAAGYYLLASRIPQSEIADIVGAQGLPKIYAALLAALSLILIARSTRAAQSASAVPLEASAHRPDAPRHAGWRTAGMLAIGALYVASVAWLGYILSIAGLIAGTIYLQGGRLDRRAAAVAIAGALLLWLLFVRLLHIPHPSGIWSSVLSR